MFARALLSAVPFRAASRPAGRPSGRHVARQIFSKGNQQVIRPAPGPVPRPGPGLLGRLTARVLSVPLGLILGLSAPLAVPLIAAPAPAAAVECRNETWEANRYSVCEVDAAREDLRLFLYDPGGTPYGDFAALNARLSGQGKTLAFAMNAGMYHEDRAPVGHYVEEGRELMRVVPNAGPGNFGLLPNGVLCIAEGRADVIETLRFEKSGKSCRFATQSGPMLVIDGALHPRFLRDSSSRYLRNGVGTSADGRRVVFVISRNAVTFWEFASFFRDGLQVPQALYLDGNVSRLYAPELGRDDWGRQMGPIVAVVTDRPDAGDDTDGGQ